MGASPVAASWASPASGDEGAGARTSTASTTLCDRHGTVVGPGHWFEQPRRTCASGYGWPSTDELRGGLAALDAAFDETVAAGETSR